jgi:succinate dehydrogenase / fumarate reductase cytochrome b subunit
MSWLDRILHSSIGRKALVASTGILLVGFLVVHLAGNLTLFADSTGEAFTNYEHALGSNPLLPVAEIGLLVLFVVHIGLAVRVTLANREARRQGYAVRATVGRKTFASGTMIVTGVLVLAFLVVHLMDFRVPKLFGSDSVANMADAVKARLATPVGGLVYLVGVGALGLHLSHGFKSAFQTLGANHPRYTPWIERLGILLALVFFLGFALFPVYFLVRSRGAH